MSWSGIEFRKTTDVSFFNKSCVYLFICQSHKKNGHKHHCWRHIIKWIRQLPVYYTKLLLFLSVHFWQKSSPLLLWLWCEELLDIRRLMYVGKIGVFVLAHNSRMGSLVQSCWRNILRDVLLFQHKNNYRYFIDIQLLLVFTTVYVEK